MLLDFLLTFALFGLWYFYKGANGSFVAFVCLSLPMIYAYEPWGQYWKLNSDVTNHFIYGAPFVIGSFFAPRMVKFSLVTYAILNLVASIDALLYGNNALISQKATWIYDNYLYAQIACVIFIIITIIRSGHGLNTGTVGRHYQDNHTPVYDILRHNPHYQGSQKG